MNITQKSHTALTLALCGAVTAQAVWADGNSGVYIQGDVGVSSLQVGSSPYDRAASGLTERVYSKNSAVARLGGGYDFGDWRLAGDYTYYRRVSKNQYVKARAQSAGVSAIFDVDTGTSLQPYVGARLALTRIKSDFGNPDEYISHEKVRVSPGVMAGVSMKIDPKLSVDAGYRYNHMDADLKAHEVSVGMRYTF